MDAGESHRATRYMCRTGDDTLSCAKDIRGELMFFSGRQDPHVPLDGRKKIHSALCDANVDITWHEFNAQHAFIRDEGHRYDLVLAMQCHQMALELFHRQLGEGGHAARTSRIPAGTRR